LKNADLTWFELSICSGETALFFPPSRRSEGRTERVKRERLAAAVCEKCPVMEKCKQHARDQGELGFWGGESEEQRYLAGYLRDSIVSRRRKYAKMHSAEVLAQFNEKDKASN
jgi:WhiB family redox-sensing transcriptional regulator